MKNIGTILLLIILPLFFYFEFASSHSIFVQKDWLARNYPFREEAVKMIKDRITPLWNPYILCGAPLFADVDLGIGYPLNILNLFMPLAEAVKWSSMLHITLGGLFMYIFLRILNLACFGSIIGAITFMLGGYMQSFIPIQELCINTIYTPLIFLFFELGLKKEKKIFISFGGITLALQILSGVPQMTYYTLLALFLYAIYSSLVRKPSTKFIHLYYFILLAIIGFSLSAFQLIPLYEYYIQNAKLYFQTTQGASAMGTMLPHAILFFIGVADPYTSGFIGISGLFLALVAIILCRNKLSFFFTGLCILVLASAFEITHLYKILFYLPGFNMFPSLHRFIMIYAFGISILAGFGANTLSNIMYSDNNRLKNRISLSIFIIACILILTFSLNWFLKSHIISFGQGFIERKVYAQPGHPLSLSYYYKKLENLHSALLNVLGLAIFPATGIFILISLVRAKRISRVLFQTGLVCIILLELYGHWERLNWKLVEPDEYYRPSEAVSFIKKDTSIYRAFGLDIDGKYHFDYENSRKIKDLMIPNLGTIHHIQDPQGMENFPLRNYWQLFDLLNRKRAPLENVYSHNPFYMVVILNPNHNLVDLLNCKYLLTYHPLKEGERWRLVFDKRVKVYQNKKVIPRVFIAYNYIVPKSEDALLRLLDDPDFNMQEIVILDRDIGNAIGPHSPNTVEIKKYSPLEIKIDTYTENPGILVFGDSFYPGWRAKIDGRYVKILRAYSIFRAIPLAKGPHEIIFNYLPFSFIGGCAISITALFFMILEGFRKLLMK